MIAEFQYEIAFALTIGIEYLVLLAIVRLRSDAYGMRVRREIGDRTGRDTSIGAVYATLDRLETKGLISGALSQAFANEPDLPWGKGRFTPQFARAMGVLPALYPPRAAGRKR